MKILKKKNKKVSGGNVQSVYLTNVSDKVVVVGNIVVEPDDAKSIPIELEKEAREKGLV